MSAGWTTHLVPTGGSIWTDNYGVHTERGLRPDLKWKTLISPPGDAGR